MSGQRAPRPALRRRRGGPDGGGVLWETVGALRRRGRPLARLAAWSLAEVLPALLTGYATARAVDDGFLAGRPTVGLTWLAALAVAVGVGAVGTGRTYACLADVVEPFRDELATRVVNGALRRGTEAGARPDTAAVARLTQQVEIVRDTFGGLVMVVRGFLFASGAALVGLFSLAPVVAALVAAPLAVGVLLLLAALPAMAARQREYVYAGERLAESAGGVLAGHRDVAACGAQHSVTGWVGRHVDDQAAAERQLARMAALRSLSLAVGGWLPLVVLLVAAPWLVRDNGLTPGAVLGALVYISTGLHPALHTLVQTLTGGGLRYTVTLDRILRSSTPPAPPPAGTRPAPPASPRQSSSESDSCLAPDGRVELRQVTFRYGPRARPVLDGFDLYLPDGDHLTVVGPSGAGKSTLAALMAGTLAPDGGTVRLSGRQIAGCDPAALAPLRVLVPQEAYVFAGSVVENLRYLAPDADLKRVRETVEMLGATPLVDRLGGLDSQLDPARLSAGERQLLAAVRAYLSPAPTVILDEATCHLDPVAESRVEATFAARPGTLVVIAHRISSALRARQVLILDGGAPLLGPHDELVLRSPTYRGLVGHWAATDAVTGAVVSADADEPAAVGDRDDPVEGNPPVAHR